ncbi:MAG: helix-turn-helix transcriptional regulator [Lachnospiraceae bacterium]|nr:helix-turn-helix transcriptional regulator [Lachnospiraceae bacterium]
MKKNQIELSKLRKEKNLSQRDLADIIHVSSATIGFYETGRRTPPLKKAIAIAEYFNLPVERIQFSNK